MKRDIIVIGGGVIGLMSAYFLIKSGRKVTIIEEGDITFKNSATSFGNAGLLSSFDKTPLSYPGVITNTLKLMLKGESPAQIHFRWDWKLYRWLWRFVQSANEQRMKHSMKLFEHYGQKALDLYEQIMRDENVDFDYHHDGLLMVYTEQNSFELKKAHALHENNEARFEICDVEQTKAYLPCANDKIKGSVLLKKNAHLDPKRVMDGMKSILKRLGAEFILNTKISDVQFENQKIKAVQSKDESYEANEFIMATGHQTLIANKAKKELMMTPAKGYSITFEMPIELKPKMSTLFADMFIAFTPRRDTVRITSKLELGSSNTSVVASQIESIKRNFKAYTTPFEMKNEVHWCGFRPLTPNDMPLLGRDENYTNLTYATGLGWLGITFAPAIGEVIASLICENKTEDIKSFSGFYQK